jgi:hypothetical protein
MGELYLSFDFSACARGGNRMAYSLTRLFEGIEAWLSADPGLKLNELAKDLGVHRQTIEKAGGRGMCAFANIRARCGMTRLSISSHWTPLLLERRLPTFSATSPPLRSRVL